MTYQVIGAGLSKRLDRVEGELRKLQETRRGLWQALQDGRARISELDQELLAGIEEDHLAVAAGGSASTDRARMHAELATARERLADLEREVQAVDRAVARKEQEARSFVVENAPALFEAHAPQAAKAAAEVTTAIDALRKAAGRLSEMEQRSCRLIAPLDGMDGRSVPDTGLGKVINALDGFEVRVPLPREMLGDQ